MTTHAIDRMGASVGLFGATRSLPFGGRKAGKRIWGPVLCSAVVHLVLIAGAWMIEIPEHPAVSKDEPIEVSLLAGPGPAASAGDELPGLPEAPAAPPPPVRRAAPPAPRQQAPKVLAVAPAMEESPAPKEEVVADVATAEEEAAPAEEAEAAHEERGLLDGALADASGALHGQRGGGGGGLGGGGDGSGSHLGGGSPFGDVLVDGSTAAVPSRILEKVQPDYPRMARRRGVEGVVLLRVVVDKEGRVEPELTEVLESVPGLDAASVAAARHFRFTPALDRTGAPVRVFLRVPFRFTLQ